MFVGALETPQKLTIFYIENKLFMGFLQISYSEEIFHEKKLKKLTNFHKSS